MTFIPIPLNRIVPPEGKVTAKIAIVGEAPGADEDRQLRPFVGRAGTVLDQCLHSAGLTRSDVYLTNLVKVRPPKNNFSSYCNAKGLTEKGRQAAIELYKELQGVDANVIVTLGNPATLALAGKSGITKQRGSVLPALPEADLRQKIIPCIHPASTLRGNYIWKYFIVADLKKAKRHSTDATFPEAKRLEVNMSFQEALAWMDYFKGKSPLACDIEVVNHELACISFSDSSDLGVSIPFYHNWTTEEEIALYMKLQELLGDSKTRKVGQNFIFDKTFLMIRNGIYTRGPIDDTMIGQSLLYPDFPKGLDFITSIYTDMPYYKDEGKDWRAPKDHEKFREYNAKDAVATFESSLKIMGDIDKLDYRGIYNFTMRLHDPLIYMMLRGIRADHDRLVETKKEISTQMEAFQKELNILCEADLNFNSPKQVREYFYIKKGITPYTKSVKNSTTGEYERKITCDDKALQRIAKGTSIRPAYREAKLIQELRGLGKLKGTYLDIDFDEDKRMRCSYNPRGTKFGRLSSSKNVLGNGTNMQNLPEAFKGFLIADEGKVFIELDKAGAEWVVVAYITGDANMIKVCQEKLDPHVHTAHLMTGLPKGIIETEAKLLGHLTDAGEIEQIRHTKFTKDVVELFKKAKFLPRNMSARQCGKKSNHGLNYDEGYKTFALVNEMLEGDAKTIVNSYKNEVYPGVRRWHQFVQEKLGQDRSLTNFFGRKQRFLDAWGPDLFKSAYAFIPQSTVSDLLNWSIIYTYEDKTPCMDSVELLAQVHDSVLIQMDLGEYFKMAQAVHRIRDHMNPVLHYNGRDFQIGTDMKVGFDWRNMEEVKFQDTIEIQAQVLEATIKKLQQS